jgi:hypothetical protein
MRALADAVTAIAGTLTIFGFLYRHFRSKRRSANLEHIRQLEAENQEIDALLEPRIGKREEA